MRRSALSRNHYFVFGLLLGLVLSFYLPQDIWELVQQEECPQEAAENSLIEKFGQDFEPHLNLVNKPLAAKKPVKNVVRPRYYSSELGIREKIFIGVMTSQANIDSQATAINRTSAHLVNKIKFFINADTIKTNYKLKNIVGFTDTRENLRPFHVIKYIADNYLDDYDYFLLITDSVYVNARKLKAMLYHLSITFDIYMGTRTRHGEFGGGGGAAAPYTRDGALPVSDERGGDEFTMLSDRNYCDLNAGILLSSSVIRKMRNNLDWCVRNGITNVHGVNIGRCVKYSSNLAGCQTAFQGVQQQTYALRPNVQLFKDLQLLAKEEAFRNATSVYPVTTADDFYRLHAYFSRHHLEQVHRRSGDLERKSYRIANGTISNHILEIRWPLGVPPDSMPETRHDIIVWQLINRTHVFLPNAEEVVAPHSHLQSLDLEKVLDVTLQYAVQRYPDLEFVDLHSVYRRFDSTRGMDYQLHLNFRPTRQRRGASPTVLKSFKAVKPLGRVEVVPSPYVTESTRIAILVPTFEEHVHDALQFIKDYERVCMRNQDNTFLLMVFLYRFDSASKGETDPFVNVKTLALDLSAKYKSDGSRIAWVSVRLPFTLPEPSVPEDYVLNSVYGRHEVLSIAVADLALPKIGLDSLVLMASTAITFKADFLNRVRMNTIQSFQVYSPIGFMLYPCKLAYFCKECETCDVSQSTGYFDKWNHDLIAFYSRDYVQARRAVQETIPILRSDTDIEKLLPPSGKEATVNTILDMFLLAQLPLHILRGVEPNVRYGNTIKHYIEATNDIPRCQAIGSDDDHRQSLASNNNYSNDIPARYEGVQPKPPRSSNSINSLDSRKCVRLASRKQIGDAIIRYEDKSILHK